VGIEASNRFHHMAILAGENNKKHTTVALWARALEYLTLDFTPIFVKHFFEYFLEYFNFLSRTMLSLPSLFAPIERSALGVRNFLHRDHGVDFGSGIFVLFARLLQLSSPPGLKDKPDLVGPHNITIDILLNYHDHPLTETWSMAVHH